MSEMLERPAKGEASTTTSTGKNGNGVNGHGPTLPPTDQNIVWAPMMMPSMGEQQSGQDEEPVEWRRYVEAVRRRLWLVLALVVVAGSIAAVVTLRQTKQYQSATTVVIDSV